MAVFHMMLDEARQRRLCDGKPLKRPLPHYQDDVELCPECETKYDDFVAKGDPQKFGVGLSMTMR